MRGVVLTYDAQLGLAQLVVARYAALWPGHPVGFHVPVNGGAPGPAHRALADDAACRLVLTPRGIVPSMAGLLDGLGADDWVFWCIDDRYPTWLDAAAIAALHRAIGDGAADGWSSVKLLHWKEPLLAGPVELAGLTFAEQVPASRRWGFWHHQFVRVGVLRHVFSPDALTDDCRVDDVQARLFEVEGDQVMGRALVPTRDLLQLAEPLVDGRLTANGVADLEATGCEVPAFDRIDDDIVYGNGGEPIPGVLGVLP